MLNRPVKWAAELSDVEEASVVGVADLAYWKDYLRQADLISAEREAKAQVMIVAAAARFAGIRFRELSFSVFTAQPGHRQSAYLVQAVNSCRLFAFSERTFFSTPYRHADVRLSSALPAFIELTHKELVLFRVQMQAGQSAASREPLVCGEDRWEGAVFLPDRHKQGARRQRKFFARVKGYTKRYPFLCDRDSLKIEPSPDMPALQALVDSHFAPTEWVLRRRAIHAKSKTYKRGDFPAL
jgi:hypothetical protein